jgi:hypothetical protein
MGYDDFPKAEETVEWPWLLREERHGSLRRAPQWTSLRTVGSF